MAGAETNMRHNSIASFVGIISIMRRQDGYGLHLFKQTTLTLTLDLSINLFWFVTFIFGFDIFERFCLWKSAGLSKTKF